MSYVLLISINGCPLDRTISVDRRSQILTSLICDVIYTILQRSLEELLKYAEDLTVIPSFPLAPVSYSAGGKLRLGECILWTVETIRLGNNASMVTILALRKAI